MNDNTIIQKHFYSEIKDRIILQFKPFNHLYFVYMLFFLIILGGLGIWISVYQEINNGQFSYLNVSLNICTYYIALLSTSYIDVNTNHSIENRLSLKIYSFIILGFLIFLFWLSFRYNSYISLIISSLGMVISLFIWHIANSDNEKFSDETYNKKLRDEAKNKHGKNW
jgi:uncharacterized membrane protein